MICIDECQGKWIATTKKKNRWDPSTVSLSAKTSRAKADVGARPKTLERNSSTQNKKEETRRNMAEGVKILSHRSALKRRNEGSIMEHKRAK